MAPVEARRLILDSTVLVRHLRGEAGAAELVRRLEGTAEVATTAVNAFEVHYGAHRARNPREALLAAKGLLSSLALLPLEGRAAERAAELKASLERQGRAVDIRDLLIAAIALEGGYAVVTHNKRHFARVPGLVLAEPDEVERDR